jgi:hypothetical protein
MPTWRNKPANRVHLNKRYTPERQQARKDAARDAVRRLYCDSLELWRTCAAGRCRRHRRCAGDSRACMRRVWNDIPRHREKQIWAAVIAGGPRKIAPANHVEWNMRRNPPDTIARL